MHNCPPTTSIFGIAKRRNAVLRSRSIIKSASSRCRPETIENAKAKLSQAPMQIQTSVNLNWEFSRVLQK